MTDFSQYIIQGEPNQREKAVNWQIAIGLQEVDGLKPSAYLLQQAKANIEGEKTIEEVQKNLHNYYKNSKNRKNSESEKTEEADKVSAKITEILGDKAFTFSPTEYIGIHRRLFAEIDPKIAGKIRDYNITKKERVLDGDTVYYADFRDLKETLKYDFEQEKNFNYRGLNDKQIIEHLAKFIANLWQIHIFGEGNTRTTAVFLIKYLRSLGYKNITNDLFAEHSWYFRNSLVRANYENLTLKVNKTLQYLIKFLSNLLLEEHYELKNRYLHIQWEDENVTDNVTNVTDRNVKIIELIKANPSISTAQMAKALSVAKRTILRDINKLKQDGKIERIGNEKTGTWKFLPFNP